MGKHSAVRRSTTSLLLGVVAVLAAMAVVIIVPRALSSSGPAAASSALSADTSATTESATPSATSTDPAAGTATTATASTTSPTAGAPTESAEDAAARAALQQCVARQNAAQPVVAAATTGAQHWADHVQGQTDLDSGARSLDDVKTNTWGPTRAAGPADVAAFQSAVASYATVGGCQNVAALPASADVTPKLQACAAREQALETYVDAAKAVMADWATHLQEMADHAGGHVDNYQAQVNWLNRYREAPTHLNPYKAAQAALAAAPACSA